MMCEAVRTLVQFPIRHRRTIEHERNSIRIAKASRTTAGFESSIFSGVQYADRIEFGSPRNPPYPFMRPAAYFVMKPMAAMLAKAAREGLEGA